MDLTGKRVLLTGAAGGIGRETAGLLGKRNTRLAISDCDRRALASSGEVLRNGGFDVTTMPADLADEGACRRVVTNLVEEMGGIDILINLAGIQSFTPFEDEDPKEMELTIRTNLLAPMWLTRAALPQMLKAGAGRIVNVGSIFGSIGFAYFTTYSTSKFGLRGFSEALRRELAGTGVNVTYVAPRATRTPLNRRAVYDLAETSGMRFDAPATVAGHILRAIEKDKKNYFIGWPERLFVRINSLMPQLLDGALRKQNLKTRKFAQQEL